MTKKLDLIGLKSIADNYDLFYIDLWGVIHNGVKLHEKAITVLKEISKKNKSFVLLTNAPRPNETVKNFLEKMGMGKDLREHVFTSGEAALGYLKKNLLSKKFYHIGPPRDFDLFNLFENNKSEDIKESEYLLCTGLFDDHEDDLSYYKNLLEKQTCRYSKDTHRNLGIFAQCLSEVFQQTHLPDKQRLLLVYLFVYNHKLFRHEQVRCQK